MSESIETYIKIQGIGPVIGNMILNPFLSWLGTREMENATLFGAHSIIIDTAITSIVASLLVTLFTASGVRRDLKARRIAVPESIARTKSPLFRLPRKSWTLGLVLGVGIAVVLVSLTLAVFHLFNIIEISFQSFMVIKAMYTGLLGLLVTRWVILRELAPNRRSSHKEEQRERRSILGR